jgi:hypothetical protein
MHIAHALPNRKTRDKITLSFMDRVKEHGSVNTPSWVVHNTRLELLGFFPLDPEKGQLGESTQGEMATCGVLHNLL